MAAKSAYLDYNATSPLRPDVAARMAELLGAVHNASSTHAFGRAAKKLLEDARVSLSESLNTFANEIIFTGSATEANNWALNAYPDRSPFVSAVEHPSVLKARGDATVVPVDQNGVIDLAALEAALKASQKPALVSVMLANNESGVVQPISDVARTAREHGALVHTDAVQAAGRMPIDFSALQVDMMTLSTHKCGGPIGAGALVIRNDLPISPMLKGGGQELNRRAGTENIPAIVGMSMALRGGGVAGWRRWRDTLEDRLCAIAAEVEIAGYEVNRLPNTTCITMPGVAAETQLMHFDLAGFAVSAGAACSSGRVTASHVLLAMGWPEAKARTAIRISTGWGTTEAEIDAFAACWEEAYKRLGKKK